MVQISSNFFFVIFGMSALSAGCPTTKSKYGFSFFGLSKISFKNFIGLGVWVKVTNPEKCNAVINIPVAIPTDS